jgi:16S rRNA U516 pseudouridylate synthase RsuA-like enzyme
MLMPFLGHRLQVLLDEGRYRRLEQRAAEQGRPVAALVRDAIDMAFPSQATARRQAGKGLLDMPPMAVGDWDEMKQEILDATDRGL